jgi:hypothetical protein
LRVYAISEESEVRSLEETNDEEIEPESDRSENMNIIPETSYEFVNMKLESDSIENINIKPETSYEFGNMEPISDSIENINIKPETSYEFVDMKLVVSTLINDTNFT